MSDQTQPQPDSPETDQAASGETITIPVAEFEAMRGQVVEWKERCMRNQAEFENIRKRLRKEADEARTRGVAHFVRPILDQLDNLDRALGAAAPESFSEFAQGVTMIRESLSASLTAAGIEPIPKEGVFDPSIHEVLAEEAREGMAKGTILLTHRSGWKLKDQLIRSAQVVVAK